MSEENVELYRRGIEAFNRRDLDAFLALAHPDVVGISRFPAIEGDSYRGHDGRMSSRMDAFASTRRGRVTGRV